MSVKQLFEGALLEYDDVPTELQGALAYSGTGRLYIATDDGKLRSADIRQQLVSGEWAQAPSGGGGEAAGGRPAKAASPLAVRTIFPSPPLDLSASHFVLNRSGTYAALAGPTTEDPELSGVAVVDLSSCRPSREGDHDIAAAFQLDPTLFEARVGLRVLQVAWHPDSDCHLAVLTSDATWRLYNTQHPDLAEQTFELQLRGRRRLGLDSDAPGQLPVAFAFGTGEGWDRLAVYFCTAAGHLYTLCPVVPFGCRYPARLIQDLRESAEEAAAGADLAHAPTSLAWLDRAFQPAPGGMLAGGSPGRSPSGGVLYSVPHALEEHVPALGGPLPVEAAGGEEVSIATLAGRHDSAQAMLMTRFGSDCTALVVATGTGTLGLYVMSGEGAGPLWAESTPQCITEGVDLRAVRSQVPAALAPAPSFLLLDAVTLGLGAQQAQQGGELDDEDYYADEGGAPGRRIALCADPAVGERLYCVHPAGAHAVTLSWLPLLSDFLGGAGGDEPPAPLPAVLPAPAVEELLLSKAGAVDGVAVGDALSGSALVVLEASGAPRCLRPRPAAGAAEGGAAAVGDLGAGAAAAGAKAGTAPLLPGLPLLAAEPSGTGAAAAGEGGAAAASTAVARAAVERDVEAHAERVYGDLLSGPSGPALPALPAGPLGAADSAGQRHLSACIAALRSRHVEFAHQAHHDLLQRLGQLRTELERQRAKQEGLAALAGSAKQAGDSLDARLERVARFQENISSRLALLGELHWSLPRPPSEAERVLQHRELPEFEAASRQLEEDVRALHGRVGALQRKARSMGQVAASHAALAVQVPPQQLRRMREALSQQEAAIEGSLALLGALEATAAAHEPAL